LLEDFSISLGKWVIGIMQRIELVSEAYALTRKQ
jgi:hypothetical protein